MEKEEKDNFFKSFKIDYEYNSICNPYDIREYYRWFDRKICDEIMNNLKKCYNIDHKCKNYIFTHADTKTKVAIPRNFYNKWKIDKDNIELIRKLILL